MAHKVHLTREMGILPNYEKILVCMLTLSGGPVAVVKGEKRSLFLLLLCCFSDREFVAFSYVNISESNLTTRLGFRHVHTSQLTTYHSIIFTAIENIIPVLDANYDTMYKFVNFLLVSVLL